MIVQAKRLDNGEVIEDESFLKRWHEYKNVIFGSEGLTEIDPKTLKYSFDNGETWHSEDKIQGAISYCNTYEIGY